MTASWVHDLCGAVSKEILSCSSRPASNIGELFRINDIVVNWLLKNGSRLTLKAGW